MNVNRVLNQPVFWIDCLLKPEKNKWTNLERRLVQKRKMDYILDCLICFIRNFNNK